MNKIIYLIIFTFFIVPVNINASSLSNLKYELQKIKIKKFNIKNTDKKVKKFNRLYKKLSQKYYKTYNLYNKQKIECNNLKKDIKEEKLDKHMLHIQNKKINICYKTLNILAHSIYRTIVHFKELEKDIEELNKINEERIVQLENLDKQISELKSKIAQKELYLKRYYKKIEYINLSKKIIYIKNYKKKNIKILENKILSEDVPNIHEYTITNICETNAVQQNLNVIYDNEIYIYQCIFYGKDQILDEVATNYFKIISRYEEPK